MLEAGETSIDISPLFASNETMNIKQVINYCQDNYISPRSFIDIKAYQDVSYVFKELEIGTDYRSLVINFEGYFQDDRYIYLAVYVDLEFVNATLNNINDFYKSRISENPSKKQKKKH